MMKKVTIKGLWRIIKSYRRTGGSHIGDYRATYNQMVKKFGRPETGSGDGKISTSWTFVNTESGSYVDFYDYKETDLYSSSKPTVRQFRRTYANKKFDWHIGSNDEQFAKLWLKNKKLRLLKR